MVNIFPGYVYATSDLTQIENLALYQENKIILMGDPVGMDDLIMKYRMVVAMPLVPDYITLSYLIDGDTGRFIAEYANCLRRKPAEEFFSTILTVLSMNNNIIFYVPESSNDIGYIGFFLQYLQSNFGITAKTKTTEYSYNPSYNDSNLALLYVNNMIDATGFLYGFNGDLDTLLFNKLVMELRPQVQNPNDPNDYLRYFESIQKTMREQGQVMEVPVTIEKDNFRVPKMTTESETK